MSKSNSGLQIEEKMDGSVSESDTERTSAAILRQTTIYPTVSQRRRMFLPLMGFTLCFYIGVIGWTTLLPQYILERFREGSEINSSGSEANACQVNESDEHSQEERRLQKLASQITSTAAFCCGVPAVITVLVFSSISDQLGRKVTIIIPYVGGSIVAVAIAFVVAFKLPFWVYIAANFVNGLSGSYSALLAGLFASVADVTPPERRSVAIAIIEGTLGLAMLVSNVAMGFWAKSRGYKEPIIFLASIITGSGFFFFLIHETRPRNRTEGENRVGIIEAIKKQWRHMINTLLTNKKRAKKLIFLVVTFTITMVTYTGGNSVLTLYVMGKPFCWDSSRIGTYNGIKTAVLVLGATLGVVVLRRKISDFGLTIIGTISFLGFLSLTGVASFFLSNFHNVVMGIAVVVGLLSTLQMITIRALCSKSVSANEQGAVFGLIAVGEAFSFSFGPVIMNGIFSGTVTTMSWFVYILSAGLVVIQLLLLLVLKAFFYSSGSSYVEIQGSVNE